jgi:hypothetical protein
MELTDVDERALTRFLPGDVLAVLALVLVGTVEHGSLSPQRYAGVLLPFLVGWLAAAPLVGAYSSRAAESSRAALVLAAGSWLAGDLVGQLLRNTSLFPGNADPAFFLVMFVVGTALLSVVRFASLVVADLTGS